MNMYTCMYAGCGVVLLRVELKPTAAITVSTASVVHTAAVMTPSEDTVMELPPIGGSPALEINGLVQKQTRDLHFQETAAKPMLAQSRSPSPGPAQAAAASPAMASRFSLPVFQQDSPTRYTSLRTVIADARSIVDSGGSSVAPAVCANGRNASVATVLRIVYVLACRVLH